MYPACGHSALNACSPLLSRAKAIATRTPVAVVAVTTFDPPRVTSEDEATFTPCALGIGVGVGVGVAGAVGLGAALEEGVAEAVDVALGVGVALFTGSGTPLPQTNFPAFFTHVNF